MKKILLSLLLAVTLFSENGLSVVAQESVPLIAEENVSEISLKAGPEVVTEIARDVTVGEKKLPCFSILNIITAQDISFILIMIDIQLHQIILSIIVK